MLHIETLPLQHAFAEYSNLFRCITMNMHYVLSVLYMCRKYASYTAGLSFRIFSHGDLYNS